MIGGRAIWPCDVTFRPRPSHETFPTAPLLCTSFRMLSVPYAMMEARMHTQSEHQAGEGVDVVAVLDQVMALRGY